MTKTTTMSREERKVNNKIRNVLTNYGSCRDNISFDEFPTMMSLCFGSRDFSKPEIDDLTEKATGAIQSLLTSRDNEWREKMIKAVGELRKDIYYGRAGALPIEISNCDSFHEGEKLGYNQALNDLMEQMEEK